MSRQITLIIDDEVDKELLNLDVTLNDLKVVACEAIGKLVSEAQGAAFGKSQSEDRVLAAEQLQLGTESRILRLREVNKVKE